MSESDRGLAVRTPRPMSMAEQKEFAKWAVASKKFKGIKSPQQAMMIMQFGRELGLGPATALQSVYEVNGVPALKANTIAARIKTVPWQGTQKSRYDYQVRERSSVQVTLEFYERNDDGKLESRGTVMYTINDAKLAGDLSRNDNYRSRPKSMLFARCLTEGARIYCPDCLGGIVPYCPEELGAVVDEDGGVIDADFEVTTTAEEDAAAALDYRPSAEEFASLRALADAKNVCLPDVIAGLGGDANDIYALTQSQYEACVKFITNK